MVVGTRAAAPLANASVRALRIYMGNGYPRELSVGSATTDNRGIYRILAVEPGDYVVCVSTRETGPLNEAQRLQKEIHRLRRGVEYVLGPSGIAAQVQLAPPPGVARGAPAATGPSGLRLCARLSSGNRPHRPRGSTLSNQDRSGVDFQLALTRLARIEGVVVGMPRSEYVDGFPILLGNVDGMEDSAVEGARPNLEGRFRFTNVPPGRYKLILRETAGRTVATVPFAAAADVVVADQDIGHVVLDLQPGATVEGKVVFSGTARPPSAIFARLQVRMGFRDPARAHGRFVGTLDWRVLTQAAGSCCLERLPGSIPDSSASFREAETGWFVDSATLSGGEVLDQSLEVKANES